MRKPLIAGNWKMYKTNAELPAFFESFVREAGLGERDLGVDVLFAVPATLLARAVEIAQPSGITIAAQNVHWEREGAFTGEISIPMLLDVGVRATLIVHSERRQYFGETDETVAKKTHAALAQGIFSIVCVGETLEEREKGKTEEVVGRQTEAFLEGLKDLTNLVIAYEPVWAIGTGRTASPNEAQDVHAFIRGLVEKRFGAQAAQGLRILYGGSVKPENIESLMAQPDIDGGLVGGASLKPTDFAAMVRSTARR